MIEPRNLEGRYILTSGDLHQSNLKEESIIISPLQMIKHTLLTFICFEKRMKHSRPTKSTKPGLINTQLSAKIKVLHSDRGGENIGKEFVIMELPNAEIEPLLNEFVPYSMPVDC